MDNPLTWAVVMNFVQTLKCNRVFLASAGLRRQREGDETLWGDTDVNSIAIGNLENRAVRGHGHAE
jgi:hypothetical protein